MQGPVLTETEQDNPCLCFAGQTEAHVIISIAHFRQERSAFMQHAG